MSLVLFNSEKKLYINKTIFKIRILMINKTGSAENKVKSL